MTDVTINSFPVVLTDADGFVWDIDDNTFGSTGIVGGTIDAFDGGFRWSDYNPAGGTHVLTDGREVNFAETMLVSNTGLMGSRSIYVSDTKGYARFLDTITNTTAADITYTYTLFSDVGSDSGTQIITTGDGDTTFSTADTYLTTDDFNLSGNDPTVTHIFHDGSLLPTTASQGAGAQGADQFTVTYTVTIPAGESVSFLSFGFQNDTPADAAAQVADFDANFPDYVEGLSGEELAQVANFDFSTASSGADVIVGTDGNDTLIGNDGVDFVFGGLGNDRIDLALRHDTAGQVFDGGEGIDILLVGFDNTGGTIDFRDDVVENIEIFDIAFNLDMGGTAQFDSTQFNTIQTLDVSAHVGEVIRVEIFLTSDMVVDLSGLAFTTAGLTEAGDGITINGDDDEESITGSSVNDLINGFAGNDTIIGGAGADVISGGDGDDIFQIHDGDLAVGESYDGGAGIDTLDASAVTSDIIADDNFSQITIGGVLSDTDNVENFILGSGNDTMIIGSVSTGDVFDGGSGINTIQLVNTNNTLNLSTNSFSGSASFSSADDTIINFQNVIGGSGNDTIIGDSNDNTINGGIGNDILSDGAGTDTIMGGAGNDIYRARSFMDDFLDAGDSIDGGDGIDTFEMNNARSFSSVFDMAAGTFINQGITNSVTNFENFDASGHTSGQDFTVIGTADINVITTGNGNDTIEGGAGADMLDGGDGIDTVSYESSSVGVTVNLQSNITQNGDAQGDILSNFENITGSAFNDFLVGTSGDNILIGGEGADTLDGGDGIDTVSYESSSVGVTVNLQANIIQNGDAQGDVLSNFENITGSAFNDFLVGTSGVNILIGGDGNDVVNGAAGVDEHYGGEGNDSFQIGGSNWVEAGEIYDGGAGTADNFRVIFGHSSDFTSVTVMGVERVNFAETEGSGSITFTADQFSNFTDVEVLGQDAAVISTLNINLGSATSADFSSQTFTNWSAGDVITINGSVNNDTITGTSVNDTINGDAGDDIIEGGAGADTLDGGAGIDTLSYEGSALGVTINLYASTQTATGGDATSGGIDDTISGFESFIGGSGGDVITATGASSEVYTVEGRAGNDVIKFESSTYFSDVDGGDDTDTIDFSGYTFAGLNVNLATGLFNDVGGSDEHSIINVENVTGSEQNDIITGDGGDNVLIGLGGNDVINGGGGRDTIVFSGNSAGYTITDNNDGSFTIVDNVGTEGTDTVTNVEFVEFADGIQSLPLGEIVTLTESADNHTGTAGADTIIALGGNDTIFGLAGDDDIDGGQGRDFLQGGDGDDFLFGGNGRDQDFLQGDGGADVLSGNNGSDWAYYLSSTSGLTVNLGNASLNTGDAAGDSYISIENLLGSEFGDDLTGDSGNNFISGRRGDDVLNGGAGNDTLRGDQGADTLNGGTGADFAHYGSSNAAVLINLTSGSANGGHAAGDTLISIENVLGSAFDDTLTGDSAINYLRAGNGADTLSGRDGGDFLEGQDGADILDGGDGSDWAYYITASTAVTVNLSDSSLNTGSAAVGDTYISIENSLGSQFGDNITGTSARNFLRGYFGDDVINGGGGDDILIGDRGADELNGGDGADFAQYVNSLSGVTIDLAANTAFGGDAQGDTFDSIENLFGSRHNDSLTGDSGDNFLRAHTGNDVLNGGAGNDMLQGGTGQDTFVFEVGTQSDVVIDFTDADDLLDFTDFGVANALDNAAQVGNDVVFTFGTDVITIEDVTLADLADNFI